MILAGSDVVRLNFSHDTVERPPARGSRSCASAPRRSGATSASWSTCRVRRSASEFENGRIAARSGRAVHAGRRCPGAGNAERCGLDYRTCRATCGRRHAAARRRPDRARRRRASRRTRSAAPSRSAASSPSDKGINRQGGGLSAPALTDKDLRGTSTPRCELGADYRRRVLRAHRGRHREARAAGASPGGTGPQIIAKIERAEASEAAVVHSRPPTPSWSRAATWASRSGDAALPALQKRTIRIGALAQQAR